MPARGDVFLRWRAPWATGAVLSQDGSSPGADSWSLRSHNGCVANRPQGEAVGVAEASDYVSHPNSRGVTVTD